MACRSSLSWKKPDTTWKYGIFRDQHETGIRGRLAAFISTLLNEICFRVSVGSCLSDLYDQEMGVPARCHFICYFVHIENKQYHQMFASWRERFAVCR